VAKCREEYHDLQGLIAPGGLAIRSCDHHICIHPDQPSRLVGVRGDLQKGLCMFKSQQYRAKATEYGELVKTSISPQESREFQKLERRFASLADNEQVLADDHNSAVHVSNHDQSRGVVLAVEEEYVLRCLGAALIMQWNTFPTTLQREVIDTGGSVGKLLETESLRGQIARFLHKHKNDYGCNKLTPTEDTHSDARLGAAALSRWDDEGGAVRDGLPM
jgi:hypothetical protein